MSSTISSAFLCLGTVTAIVFNAGPDSIINVRNSPYDTIPQGKAKQKKVQYSFYNSTLNKVEVRYTDGSTELMNIEEAKKKKIQYLEVKVEVEKFTPPEIIRQDSTQVFKVNPDSSGKQLNEYVSSGGASTSDEDPVFYKTEQPPFVNQQLWKVHVHKSLPAYIETERNDKIAPGTYIVTVEFIVEKNGALQSIKAMNDPGYGLGRAAVELLMKGPKWNPAIQNGHLVRCYYKEQVRFVITP